MNVLRSMVLMMVLSGAASQTSAQEPVNTRVVVRAVARDAKIIYDNVGGARITISDSAGRVLAEGIQRGGSGDTDRIMNRTVRGAGAYDTPGAAGFVAELKLTEPTVVTITAQGPLRPAHASMKSSKTMLLLPGQHIEGDGVILELHGFIVNVNAPANLEPPTPLRITANVEMMCGCTVTSGGLWNADSIRVIATVSKDGVTIHSADLSYAGRPNTFAGTIEGLAEGAYQLRVTASHARSGNFGMHVRSLDVRDTEGVRTEEVMFQAGDIRVAATLFAPESGGPFPALAWAHGSEPGSRNELGKRNAAQRYARNGFAVLLPDKRGAGMSTGTYVETEWLHILANDQLAGVRYLKSRPDIDARRIGVIGSSQGGWVSQISAASGEVAFGVSVSGPGVTPLEQVLAQRIHEQIEDGLSDADAEQLRTWWRTLWTYYGTATGYDRVVEVARGLPDKPWFANARKGNIPAPQQLASTNFDYYRKLVGFDPDTTLQRIKVPFLGVFGSKDRHIPMPESADAMRRAFAKSGNTTASVKVFEGAGHGIQPVAELERLRNPVRGVAPLAEYIAFVDAWLRNQTAKSTS